MFTGIIESLGVIRKLEDASADATGIVIGVELGTLPVDNINIGDSIAINGTCLTVTRLDQSLAQFDVSAETLSKCLIGGWQVGESVNLERALTLQTPLGGHLVSGHVDGTGILVSRVDAGDSTWMKFEAPRAIGKFIAVKGSITIDGISLTSNLVNDLGEVTSFEVTLVPHTLTITTLGVMAEGQKVHLEIDLVARYLQRMSDSDAQATSGTSHV